MKTAIIIFLLAVSQFAYQGSHKCIHNEVSKRKSIQLNYAENPVNNRILQDSRPARKMKITYDMSYFDTQPSSETFKQLIKNITDISIGYFNNLLTIKPKPAGQMKWKKQNRTCGDAELPFQIPLFDVDDDKDSDLHLYITFTNSNQTYMAYADECQFLQQYGPTHGYVNFNRAEFDKENFTNPVTYQSLVQVAIHEMLHILGVSSEQFPKWVDSQKNPHVNPTVERKGKDQSMSFFLRTPNVLAAAQEHYGCSEVLGLPLENHGSAGSAASHWETSVIHNEIMSPSLSRTNAIFSKFTIALLKDTGYYDSVNQQMAESYSFGKGKGCSFLSNFCNPIYQDEYCFIHYTGCDYDYDGAGQCQPTYFSDLGCNIQQVTEKAKCVDMSNLKNTLEYRQKMGVNFGSDSKCFMSTLNSATSTLEIPKPLCYQYECTEANKVMIKIGDKSAFCTQNYSSVTIDGFFGKIFCPGNLERFCGSKKFCPDHCSFQGYCTNGVCICKQGFSGNNCSFIVE